MWHPWMTIPEGWVRWVLLVVLLGATLYALKQTREPLGRLPGGALAIEFGGSPAGAKAVLDEWRETGRDWRKSFTTSLDWDDRLIPAYGLLISLACIMAGAAAGIRDTHWASLGTVLAWLMWVAAALDSGENQALRKAVATDPPVSPWPEIAAYCAGGKFSFILAALCYLLGVVFLVASRWAYPRTARG